VYEVYALSYRTIVADPPWEYTNPDMWQRPNSRATSKYPALTTEDICALPVPAAEDAYLWLWITNRHIIHGAGAKVAKAWGFRPLTVMTWCKTRMGLGYYLRNATEHVIFGVKGSPGQLQRKNQVTHFSAKTHRHSGKPLGFYGVVESLCSGPYLELFARQEREDWTAWGNEIGDPLGIGFDPKGWRE